MRLIFRFAVLVLCLGAVAGCHSPAYLRRHARTESCNDRAAYLAAQTAAPLRTPEGLAPANTKNSLKIGDTAAARTRTTTEGCLDKPPNFFANQTKPALAPPLTAPTPPASPTPPVPPVPPAPPQP